MTRPWSLSGTLLAAMAAAIGASACCAGPLVLVLLGVSGAWGSRLVALEPWQPAFVGVALLAFGLAYRRLYRREEHCPPGEACAVPAVRRRQRLVFWLLGLAAVALMSFPLYAPVFS